jgi:hypothetical protein
VDFSVENCGKILDLLKSNLDKLKNINDWYKYTNNNYFSKTTNNSYYSIRNEKIYYNEINDKSEVFQINIFEFIDEFLLKCKSKEYNKSILIIKEEYKTNISFVLTNGKNIKPLIKQLVVNLPEIKKTTNVEFICKSFKEEIKINNNDELEFCIENKLDEILKLKIKNKKYYRHNFISEEYLTIENRLLLECEDYETLAHFKKIKDEENKKIK